MHRTIFKLKWATACVNPWPKSRGKRGAKAKGLKFQKEVAKALPWAQSDCWFYYHDANGPGHCSPDLLIMAGPVVLVLECKLTDWPEAPLQISELYKPVIEVALGKPVVGIVVAKNLSHKTNRAQVASSLFQAIEFVNRGIIPTWHLPWPERIAHISDNLHATVHTQLEYKGESVKLSA